MALTRKQAAQHLKRATFGPVESAITELMASDVDTWVMAQINQPLAAGAHVAWWRQLDADRKALNAASSADARDVAASVWRLAVTAPDQLRQRAAFALSQIMVVSTNSISGPLSLMVASFADLLAKRAFGNFRDLLFDVALHPAMGRYLSHLANEKGDPATGRQPDENFAREIMQLFSIGLVKLNMDGTPVKVGGVEEPTYGQEDVAGLARVFTGWSWAGPDTSAARWRGANAGADPDRYILPMQPYAQYHEDGQKTFLGVTIPAGTSALESLNTAIDTLFNHQSTAPYICRQLIQRMLNSHPTPQQVARISAVFVNDGNGVRGNLGAVVRAILLDAAGLAITPFPVVADPTPPTLAEIETYRTAGTSGQQEGFFGAIPYQLPGFPSTFTESALGGAASLVFDVEVTPGTVPPGGRPILWLNHPNTGSGYRDHIAAGRPAEQIVLAARSSAIGWVIVNGEFPHPSSSMGSVAAEAPLPWWGLECMIQHVRALHAALNLDRSQVYAVGRSRGSLVLQAALGSNRANANATTYWERQDSNGIRAVYTMQGQTMFAAQDIAAAFIVGSDRAAAVAASPSESRDGRLLDQPSIYTLLSTSSATTKIWAEAAEAWPAGQVSWATFQTIDMVHAPQFARSVADQLQAAGRRSLAVVNHTVGAGDNNTYQRILPWFESILTAPREATAAEHAAVAEAAKWEHSLYYIGPAGEGAAALADGTGAVTVGGKVAVVVDGAKGLPNRLLGNAAVGTPAAMTVVGNQPTAGDRSGSGGAGFSMVFPVGGYLQVGQPNTSAEAWAATPAGWVNGLKGRATGNWRAGGDNMESGLFVGVANDTVLPASQRIYKQFAEQIMGVSYAL